MSASRKTYPQKRNKSLFAKKVKRFRKTVLTYYRKHYRRFSWRDTRDPYKILVSEVMLQQTQANRVAAKYKAFIETFPSVEALDRAPLKSVLAAWRGLGYNRRALNLKRTARIIASKYRGTIPDSFDELIKLPGVGEYTSNAILVFAFNKPRVLIETNIRTAVLHHFFKGKTGVTDREAIRYIVWLRSVRNPREWCAALMDYGAHLKKTAGNANVRSAHYAKQSPFKGSHRELRGKAVALIAERGNISAVQAACFLDIPNAKAAILLRELAAEGFVATLTKRYAP